MWLQDLLCCRVSCEKAALLSCTPPWLFNLSSDLFCGVKLLACFCLAPHYTFCSFWVTKGGWLEWNLSSPILGFKKKTQDFVKSKFSSLCLEIICHQMRLSNLWHCQHIQRFRIIKKDFSNSCSIRTRKCDRLNNITWFPTCFISASYSQNAKVTTWDSHLWWFQIWKPITLIVHTWKYDILCSELTAMSFFLVSFSNTSFWTPKGQNDLVLAEFRRKWVTLLPNQSTVEKKNG